MVTKLSDELKEDSKLIEITTRYGKGYAEFLPGTLIGIYISKSKLCMSSSDLDIEPVYIRRDGIALPIMFPNGRFFFQTSTVGYIASYTIYL